MDFTETYRRFQSPLLVALMEIAFFEPRALTTQIGVETLGWLVEEKGADAARWIISLARDAGSGEPGLVEDLDDALRQAMGEPPLRRELVLPKGRRVKTGLPLLYPTPPMPAEKAAAAQRATIREWSRKAIAWAHENAIDDEEEREEWGRFLEGNDGLPDEDFDAAIQAQQQGRLAARAATKPATPPRLLIRGAQGSGKTKAVLQALAALRGRGLRVWLMVPTIKRAEATLNEYREIAGPGALPAIVIRGRNAESRHAPGEKMCRRSDIAQKAQREGVNVEEQICQHCPFRDACEYREQQAEAVALRDAGAIYILAHEYLYLPSSTPVGQIIVIDEAISGPVHIDMPLLGALTEVPDRLRDREDGQELIDLLLDVRDCLAAGNNCARAEIRKHIPLADLRAASKALLKMAKPPEVAGLDDAGIKRALERDQGLREWARCAREILRAIIHEYNLPEDAQGTGRASFRAIWLDEPRGGPGGPRFLHVSRLRGHKIGKKRPVLWLDGTGDPDLCRRIVPGLEDREFAIDRRGRIIQSSGKSFSRSSLTAKVDPDAEEVLNPEKGQRAARDRAAIRALADKVPGTFVATAAPVEDLLKAEGLQSQIGHFGALAGLNDWENCPRALVAGSDTPPIHALEDTARGYSARDPEPYHSVAAVWSEGVRQSLFRITRLRRMRDGTVRATEMQCHPDPLTDAVLRQRREAQVLQAVDRVRAVFNDREMVLLNNLALPFAIDEERPAQDLLDEGRKAAGEDVKARGISRLWEIMAGADAVPLSAERLTAVWPQIWPSRDAAWAWLKNLGGAQAVARAASNYVEGPVTENLCHGILHLIRPVSFRAEGARGRPSIGLVREGVDPAAALARVMGRPVEVLGALERAA